MKRNSEPGLEIVFLASRRTRRVELGVPLDLRDVFGRDLPIRSGRAFGPGVRRLAIPGPGAGVHRFIRVSLRTPGSCTPRNMGRQCRTGVFLFRPAPVRRNGQVKGKSPRELISPTAICRAGPATPHPHLRHRRGRGAGRRLGGYQAVPRPHPERVLQPLHLATSCPSTWPDRCRGCSSQCGWSSSPLKVPIRSGP